MQPNDSKGAVGAVDKSTITLYVADDEQLFQLLLEKNLSHMGWTVTVFPTAEQLLARQMEAPADIILTDYRMGGMDGLGLLEKIREQWPASEVILFTGFATVELAVEALRHGAFDLLTKPIDFKRLEEVLENCARRILYARENRELRRVVEKLTELNHQKEKFLAITNHELRTPTTVMVGMLKLLERRSDCLSEEGLRLVRGASQAAMRLSEAVKDLGLLATTRQRDFILKPSVCALGQLCSDVDAMAEDYRELRKLSISVSCTHGEEDLWIDTKRTVRCVAALMQNAVKFTPDGGKVEVEVTMAGGELVVTVADNGIGVPAGEEENIFELFYTASDENLHHSSDHEFGGGGMGVGLALVRGIASVQGGAVTFERRAEGGSLFKLILPAGRGGL